MFFTPTFVAAIVSLSLLSPVLAAPATKNGASTTTSTSASATPTLQVFTVNNNFETDMSNVPVVATQEIGVYNLLYWTFDVSTRGVDGVVTAGIIPHTPNNVAGYGGNSVVLNGPAQISANYPTSNIKYFTISSMYIGCTTAGTETVAEVVVSCSTTATAFDVAGNQLAAQTFDFVANGAPTQNMKPVTFGSGFQNVYSVGFTVSSPTTTVLFLDNVVTTLVQAI